MSGGDKQRKTTILLVEDDRATRVLLEHALEQAGYAVLAAGNGREALEALGQPPDTGRVDLVLSDVQMPVIDGLELARMLREADPGLPVVLLTSFGEKEIIRDALRLGVREFIDKPVDTVFLEHTLRHLLAEEPGRQWPRREAADTVAAVRKAQDTLSGQDLHGIPVYFHLAPCHPAGGDIFRVFTRSRGGYVFVLADVTGHSVESSYAVAAFLGTLAACGVDRDDYSGLFTEMNRAIAQSPFCEIPVCALLGCWTPETGRLHLVNAGLPHGWLMRGRDNSIRRIELNGTPLGLFTDCLADERVLLLEAGDRVVMGTDGLFDAAPPGETPFEARMGDIILESRIYAAGELPEAMCLLAREHGGGVQRDDMLAVVLEQPACAEDTGVLLLHLESTFDAVDRACDALGQFLDRPGALAGYAPDPFEVLTATREALLNAVIHGNHREPGRRTGLLCEAARGCGLVVSVFDEGNGFDPAALEAHDGPLREGKRGVALMTRFARRLQTFPGETRLEFAG